MSVSITDYHLATITNNSENKKITLQQSSHSLLKQDKFLADVLEQVIILNADPLFVLDYSTSVVAEYTLKLSGNKILIINIEAKIICYNGAFLLETSPNIYDFIHEGGNYTVKLFSGYFTLSKAGTSQIFSSSTGEIN